MTNSFFPGKRKSGHIGGGNPPSNRVVKPDVNAGNSRIQADGQFGRPSGKTVSSPSSRLNGVLKGANGSSAGESDKKSATQGGGMRGAYGKVRVR
jgi:hypothetical protein